MLRPNRARSPFGLLILASLVAASGCDRTASDATEATGAAPLATEAGGVPTTGAKTTPTIAQVPGLLPTPPVTDRATHEAATASFIDRGFVTVATDRLRDAPIQRLSLTLDATNGRFTGTLAVDALNTTTRPIDTLYFALAPNLSERSAASGLTLDDVRVNGQPVKTGGHPSLLSVPVRVAIDHRVSVTMRFRGRLPLTGKAELGSKLGPDDFFRAVTRDEAEIGAFGQRDGTLVIGRGYPMLAPLGLHFDATATADAVGSFPPSHVALSVTAAAPMTVVAPGVLVKTERVGTDRVHHFEGSGIREVAVIASEHLMESRDTVGGVTIRSLHARAHTESGERVLSFARLAVERLQERFGAYPYGDTLTLVETPLGPAAGGVAFPAMIAVSSLFYQNLKAEAQGDPLKALVANHPLLRETLEFTVAHEVGHMWFGHLVASDRAAAPYVDEGLASLAALVYVEAVHGDKAARRQRELQLRLPYQVSRSLGGADYPVSTAPADLPSLMDLAAITYGKAGLFFDTLRRRMSPTLFDEAARTWLSDRAHTTATAAELVDHFATRSADPEMTRTLATRWLDGRHGDADIGALDLGVLAEYVLGDASVDIGVRTAISELLGDPRYGEAITSLMGALNGTDGEGPDLAKLLALGTDLLDIQDPDVKKLTVTVTDLMGAIEEGSGSAVVKKLLDAMGPELGVDPKLRQFLELGSELVFEQLDGRPAPTPDPRSEPAP